MDLYLEKSKLKNKQHISISGSKSETNRLLLLQKIYGNIELENQSNSDDSQLMTKALNSKEGVIDIHHAGTAMRFLTAYFATQPQRNVVLTGSKRMQERPIDILVDALRLLGAKISYLNEEGFPPLKIVGSSLKGGKIQMSAKISSQYISALLLIAPTLEEGLELTLEGNITSKPYIEMTLKLLEDIGIQTSFIGNTISVYPKTKIDSHQFTIESDWSSASYFYSMVALSPIGTTVSLSSYKKDSLQGDSKIAQLYSELGVETSFEGKNTLKLTKVNTENKTFYADLIQMPDIAQTLVVTCFGLKIPCKLTGLHTLKIKETDRLEALKIELTKLGACIEISDSDLSLQATKNINKDISITTYHDHRMALAFAPLALLVPIFIKNAEVVSKSYVNYWQDLKHLGFVIR